MASSDATTDSSRDADDSASWKSPREASRAYERGKIGISADVVRREAKELQAAAEWQSDNKADD
jgi:hypothetical protein